VGFQTQSLGTSPPQPQAHHPRGPCGAGRFAVAGPLGQQGLKAAQLVAQGQGPVGIPLPLTGKPKAIQPGAAPATQPTTQQAIREGRLSP
jgi:hypothetical protein